MRLLACILLLAGLALADGASGKWSGTLSREGHEPSSAYLVLSQHGTEITGTAGPDESQQWTLSKGKIEGNRITAEVASPEGTQFKLTLVLDGDHLKGDVTANDPNEGNIQGKIDLSRVK